MCLFILQNQFILMSQTVLIFNSIRKVFNEREKIFIMDKNLCWEWEECRRMSKVHKEHNTGLFLLLNEF